MNGNTLFRIILTVLVATWAVFSIIPPNDTPFEKFALSEVAAYTSPDGEVTYSLEENREGFNALLDRAQALVDEHAGQEVNPYPSVYVALLSIAHDEDIDLARYFGNIDVSDVKNQERRNRLLMSDLLARSKGSIQYGLDLNGGVSITFSVPEEQLDANSYYRSQQLNDARNVILNRVDGLGVTEPVVRVKGENMIEILMPGISSKDNPNIIDTIAAPALLEFKLVHRSANPRFSEEAPLGYVEMEQEYEDPETGEMRTEALYVQRIPVMLGDIIDSARPQITPTGGYEVSMDFTDEGRRQFAEITGQIADANNEAMGNIGRLAIVLDGQLISSPTVRERINSSSARITGRFDQREAFELANALNNPLEVELEVTEMYEVGPTLAKDSRDASVNAAILGGLLVLLFMIAYYWTSGVVAMVAVCLNLVLVIGALAGFGATITLPGVAALVLTIGMAVDASILIFERIREERNEGKSVHHSVLAGFEKALSTIVDANVTTLITAIILIWLGTGPVKGFGVTLSVGIFATVFCALIAMRWMMDLLTDAHVIRDPFRVRLLPITHIKFLDYAKQAFIASWCIVIIGVVAFYFHRDQVFGIDFTGGDEVTVAYEEAISTQEIAEIAATATFTNVKGETVGFGEVSSFFQTPLGADEEFIVVQTERGKGNEFFEALAAAFPQAGLEKVGETQIGSAVGKDVTRSAIWSIVVALFAILLYIAFRFEIGFGIGAVTATIHDVLMTIGVFVSLGEFLELGSGQFTAPMIAAVLMTVGYSINDTIVVFDRIREELTLNPGISLRRIVHLSINRTLSRTVLTSLTTLFASLALFLFGAGVIKDFALVFMIGIITGTFSSVFIASPVFYWYHKGDRHHVEKREVLPSYDWTSEGKKQKTTKE